MNRPTNQVKMIETEKYIILNILHYTVIRSGSLQGSVIN
jgi:hypothetical protein